ncbi:MAG: oligosaccharide flippase family protein [Gammaproteobacteria bacterium]
MADNFITLTKHSLIYFFANIIPAVISFAMLFAYTRLLVPADYGLYYLLYSAAILVMSITFGGLGLAVARFWSGMQDERQKQIFISTYSLIIIVLLVFMLIIFAVVLMLFYLKYRKLVIFWGLGVFVTQSMLQLNLDYLRAEIKPIIYSGLNCIKSILGLTIALLLIYHGWGINGALAGIVAANLIALLLFVRANYRWLNVKINLFNYAAFKQILFYAAPLSVNFGLNYLIANSDRWLIASLLSIKQAGLYSAAYNLPLYCLSLIMTVVNLAAYPIIMKAYEQQGDEAAKSYLSKQLLLFLGLVLPTCFGLILLNRNFIYFALGSQFRNSAIMLMPFIVVATFFSGLKTNYLDFSFQLKKNTVNLLWISIIILVGNVILNLILIPIMGILGSAVASMVAFGIGLLISFVWGRKYFELPFPIKQTWKIIMPLIVMVMVLTLINNWHGKYILFLQITIAIIAYVLTLLLFNWRDSLKIFTQIIISES